MELTEGRGGGLKEHDPYESVRHEETEGNTDLEFTQSV